MKKRAQFVLDFLTEYGPSTMPVLDLAFNASGEDPEDLLQLLHYLEDRDMIVVVTVLDHEPARPLTLIERT